MNGQEEVFDTYVIPPNFIDTGTIMGGMFGLRNAIEAAVIMVSIGFPVFHLPLSLTSKIIVLCITALPLTLLALIGVAGESISSFVLNFFRYLARRRILYRADQTDDIERLKNRRPVRDFLQLHLPQKPQKEEKKKKPRKKRRQSKSKPAAHKRPAMKRPPTVPLAQYPNPTKKEMSKGVPQKRRPHARAQLPPPKK